MSQEALFMVVIVSISIFFGLCIAMSEHHLLKTKRETHHLRVRQREVATRWKERQMAIDDTRGKHARVQ